MIDLLYAPKKKSGSNIRLVFWSGPRFNSIKVHHTSTSFHSALIKKENMPDKLGAPVLFLDVYTATSTFGEHTND